MAVTLTSTGIKFPGGGIQTAPTVSTSISGETGVMALDGGIPVSATIGAGTNSSTIIGTKAGTTVTGYVNSGSPRVMLQSGTVSTKIYCKKSAYGYGYVYGRVLKNGSEQWSGTPGYRKSGWKSGNVSVVAGDILQFQGKSGQYGHADDYVEKGTVQGNKCVAMATHIGCATLL